MITFTTNRTLLTLGGSVSTAIGFAALIWPSITARIFAFLVGAFFLIEAITDLASRNRERWYRWTAITQGSLGLIIALVLVLIPGIALRFVVMAVAIWLLLRGGLHLYVAFQHRGVTGFPLFSGLSGGISALVGLLLVLRPEAGIVAFSWLIGIYAMVIGISSLYWSYRLKNSTF